ncbi:MAG: sialidase family protein [Bryobacteraceae bacterium]
MKAILFVLIFLPIGQGSAAAPPETKNIIVYRETGRFGGWPANHGIWSWGDEILVGFSAAYFKHQPADRHQYENAKPEEPRLARSLDGGETWRIEKPASLLPPEQGGPALSDLIEPMDFSNPDFIMTIRYTDKDAGSSRLWYSVDRGKTWRGAFRFPVFGQPGIAARTDYVIEGKRQALVFLTAAKKNGKEGRVFCARTKDGGLHWTFGSWLGEETEGFRIMPSTVRLPGGVLLTATRTKQPPDSNWIDLFRSGDDGVNWTLASRPVPSTGIHSGNPPHMIRLRDGRLCLTYGYRGEPYGIRTRLSGDEGKTWSDETVLRADGAAWDLGYVRTAQRLDGKIVVVYYFAERPSSERVIVATIWNPGA